MYFKDESKCKAYLHKHSQKNVMVIDFNLQTFKDFMYLVIKSKNSLKKHKWI